jgi:hypothetical protein
MCALTGQLRTALHPASGIRQAIFHNILLAIGCQPEEERQGHECDLERVHLFFALSDEPAHSPASCGGQSCGGDRVEDFVAFFPEHFVKGSYFQEMKHPYTREVHILAPHTSHITPHTLRPTAAFMSSRVGTFTQKYTSGLRRVKYDLCRVIYSCIPHFFLQYTRWSHCARLIRAAEDAQVQSRVTSCCFMVVVVAMMMMMAIMMNASFRDGATPGLFAGALIIAQTGPSPIFRM